MDSRLHKSILYLRTRSLGARHALLWGGSLVLFLIVSYVWVGQLEGHLKTVLQNEANPVALSGTLSPKEKTLSVNEQSMIEKASALIQKQTSALMNIFSKGSAGLFSFIKGTQQKNEGTLQEGDELDKFLEQQNGSYQEFPKSE